MAQYPIRIDISKGKARGRAPDNRPAPDVTQGDLNRHARVQGEEASESKVMKKAPAKKFAKGGSIDGIARKGKTKAKKVTMACGGKTKKG